MCVFIWGINYAPKPTGISVYTADLAAEPSDAGEKCVRFCRIYGIPDDALLAVYSGNLGRKQGLAVLHDAVEILAAPAPGSKSVRMVIVGDGAGRRALEERLRRRSVPNLKQLPLMSAADYQAKLRDADLALVPQMPGTGQVCFPTEAVREGGFGITVPAGDASALADALRQVAARPDLVGQCAADALGRPLCPGADTGKIRARASRSRRARRFGRPRTPVSDQSVRKVRGIVKPILR